MDINGISGIITANNFDALEEIIDNATDEKALSRNLLMAAAEARANDILSSRMLELIIYNAIGYCSSEKLKEVLKGAAGNNTMEVLKGAAGSNSTTSNNPYDDYQSERLERAEYLIEHHRIHLFEPVMSALNEDYFWLFIRRVNAGNKVILFEQMVLIVQKAIERSNKEKAVHMLRKLASYIGSGRPSLVFFS